MFNRGDHVYHKPSDETWVVKRATETHVEPFGWPPCAAPVEDCYLVMTATEAKAAGTWAPQSDQ